MMTMTLVGYETTTTEKKEPFRVWLVVARKGKGEKKRSCGVVLSMTVEKMHCVEIGFNSIMMMMIMIS